MPCHRDGDASSFCEVDPDESPRSGLGHGLSLSWHTALRSGVVAGLEHLHDLANTVGATKEWRFLMLAAYRGEHPTGALVEIRGTLTLGLAVVVGLNRHRFARLVAPVGAPTQPRERLGYLSDSFLAHRGELFQPDPAVRIAVDWLYRGIIDDGYELRSVADRSSSH